MGILDIFKSNDTDKQPQKKMPWIALNEIDTLNVIAENSKSKLQLIFKDSTRCGISKMVIKQFEAEYDFEAQVDAYYLDLLNYRPISAAIAEKFEVEHQSPQLVVIKNGVAVHYASHHDISAKAIGDFV